MALHGRAGCLQSCMMRKTLRPEPKRLASCRFSAVAGSYLQKQPARVRDAATWISFSSPPQVLPHSAPPRPHRPPAPSIKDAKPFSDFLTDTFRRQHDYLRISVTERCNLRCLYCMPEEGVPLSAPPSLLTTPEIVLLSSLFVSQGVTKIRLTGGEPTVRPDILPLMQQMGELRPHGLRELCLTTNGLSLYRKLDGMVAAGLTGINLSLDTLDARQFQLVTRRAGFPAVQKSIERVIELNRAGAGIRFKINCVVMRGVNDREILPFVEMTRERDVEVRFIEYMPFDGNKWSEGKMFSFREMLDCIRERHPALHKVQDHKNDTSKTYQVPGFVGKIGFITSMTHNFCGSCNRLRITSDGNLKVCLFGNAEVSLRDILRRVNNQGEPIDEVAFEVLKRIAWADKQHLPSSDTAPLLVPNSDELLEVIGLAVKKKREKHAGIGELQQMKNRPMILIDNFEPYRTTFTHLLMIPRTRPVPRSAAASASHRPALLSTSSFLNSSATSWSTESPSSRRFSSSPRRNGKSDQDLKEAAAPTSPKLTHLTPSGAAHMVPISQKPSTHRTARARCLIRFSPSSPAPQLIRADQLRKGDALGVARVAGIMAAKRTPDLVPLCHPLALTSVAVDFAWKEMGLEIETTVSCDSKTGVEMEALTAAAAAGLTVYDMCKAVDRGIVIDRLRVVMKDGGSSGRWVEAVREEEGERGTGSMGEDSFLSC